MIRFNAMLMVLLAALAGGCGLIDKKTNTNVELPVLDGLGQNVEVAPVVNTVELDQNNPTFTFTGAGEWGPIIMASAQVEANGGAPIFQIDGAEEGFAFSGGSVSFDIEVTSSDSQFYGGEGSTAAPDVCSDIVLNSGTATADSLPNAIETCLKAWALANGYPNQMSYTVTGTALAAGGLPIPYSYAQTQTMRSEDPITLRCGSFALPGSVLDNLDRLSGFEDSVLTVDGGSVSGAVAVIWMAFVNSDAGPQAAAAGMSSFASGETSNLLTVEVAGNLKTATEAQITVSGTHTDDILFSLPTSVGGLVRASIDGLTMPGGSGAGCGLAIGATPREGVLTIDLTTTAVVDVL